MRSHERSFKLFSMETSGCRVVAFWLRRYPRAAGACPRATRTERTLPSTALLLPTGDRAPAALGQLEADKHLICKDIGQRYSIKNLTQISIYHGRRLQSAIANASVGETLDSRREIRRTSRPEAIMNQDYVDTVVQDTGT
jgi:hypothetical protein